MLDFAIGGLFMLGVLIAGARFGMIGFAVALAAYVLVFAGLFWTGKLRHQCLVRRWLVNKGYNEVRMRESRGFIDPAPMPWWRHWASYDVVCVDAKGEQQSCSAFVTGVFFCLFDIHVSVSDCEPEHGTS